MTKKQKAAPEAPPAAASHTVSDCYFDFNKGVNEHMRDAVVALASAAQANAQAIEAAAKALTGDSQASSTGIRIG